MKQLIKSTPFFRVLKRLNERRLFSQSVAQLSYWTEEDKYLYKFYTQFIRAGDLVFDVGANIGNRSKVFLKLSARVVAFEPQRECFEVLSKSFGNIPDFTLETKALGAKPGEGQMFRGDANTISTMSQDWIEAVKQSGRFTSAEWKPADIVPVTTLDHAIEKYGVPAFIKVDVEGFEEDVLKGLSRPITALSIEVTPEFLDRTLSCMQHLERLGDCCYNFSSNTRQMLNINWLQLDEMSRYLVEMKTTNPKASGDLYVRMDARV